jgi:putative ATP-dependent endonuclease of OLD family
LNQFGTGYAVLHDADREKIKSKTTGKERTNSAWTENAKLLVVTEAGRSSGKVRLVASVPNLEEAFFGNEADGEKPYSALSHLKRDGKAFQGIAALLDALIDSARPVPVGALEWATLEELAQAVQAFDAHPVGSLEDL